MWTPTELIIGQHLDCKKQIQDCMKKWHTRTSGILQWPKEGTFKGACLDEVAANIKH